MITMRQSGGFANTKNLLRRIRLNQELNWLEKYGEMGIKALAEMTPKDTGLTAASWYYQIIRDGEGYALQFLNSNVKNYVPIAIIIQYGHATKSGSWVEGVDYINPAIKPIFEEISNKIWKEVTRQ